METERRRVHQKKVSGTLSEKVGDRERESIWFLSLSLTIITHLPSLSLPCHHLLELSHPHSLSFLFSPSLCLYIACKHRITHTFIRARSYAHTHNRTHTDTRTYTRTRTHARTNTRTQVRTHTRVHQRKHAYVFIHTYTNAHTPIHTRSRTRAHTHARTYARAHTCKFNHN